MRYVAFFFILLLSLYFLFFKPFLRGRGVEYELNRLSLQLSPFRLSVGSFYLYLPLGGSRYFLALKDMRFELKDGLPRLKLREGALTLISPGRKSNSKRKPPAFTIPKAVKGAEVEIDRFLLNLISDRSVSVFVKGLSLKEGRLKAKADIIVDDLTVYFDLESAYLGDNLLNIGDLRVYSDLFDFRIRGNYGAEGGKFKLIGNISSIENPYMRIDPIALEGNGSIDYETLRVDLNAHTSEVDMKNRKRFRNLKSRSVLEVKFGEYVRLSGDLKNEDVAGRYILKLYPEKKLKVDIERFPVDSELLRVSPLMFAWVHGDLTYLMEDKVLHLNLSSDGLFVEYMSFQKTTLDLDYDFKTSEGEFELRTFGSGSVAVHASIRGSEVKGNVDVRDLFLIRDSVTAFVSHKGTLNYAGELSLIGSGTLRDLYYKDFPVGDISYKLRMKGDSLDLRYRGDGVEGSLKGRLGKEILSINNINDFKRVYRGMVWGVERGRVDLFIYKGSVSVGVRLDKGTVSRDKLRITFRGNLRFVKGETSEGEIAFRGAVFTKDKKFGNWFLEGEVKKDVVKGTYGFGDLLEGDFNLDLKNLSLITRGEMNRDDLEVSYLFKGSSKEGRATLEGKGVVLGREIPLKASLEYRGNRYLFMVEPLSYEVKAITLKTGGASIEGDVSSARVRVEPVKVSVLGEPVLSLIFRRGALSLKERSLYLDGELEGSVSGEFRLEYGEKGFLANAEGTLDLSRLSFFTATPLGGRTQGSLSFSLNYADGKLELEVKNKGRAKLYSKYFSVPMDLWLELRALGRSLTAFLTVWENSSGLSANVGSEDLKNYFVYFVSRDLPLRYDGGGIFSTLRVTSEGWFKVKDLNRMSLSLNALLTGDVEIGKLEKKGEGAGKKIPLDLDVHFDTSEPIRVLMPEGYVYANVRGWISGRPDSPTYAIRIEFLSGELKYFGRTFFVRGGTLNILREREAEEKRIDLSLINPSEDLNIFINLRGDLDDPSIVVWSEPPRSTQEIMTKLIIGSTAEGIIPVAKALFKQLGYIGRLSSSLSNILWLDITFSTQTEGQGEIGFSVNVKKKIATAFTIEYQQSTLKDPRKTYYGGSVSLPANLSFYGRVFSDKSSEIKLRFIRKFDF